MSARPVLDELVDAAEAALDADESWLTIHDVQTRDGEFRYYDPDNRAAARVALRAAFAKLPECEAAANVVAAALVKAWNEQPYVGQTAMADADAVLAVLAALAQEFGDGEASRG